MHTQDSRIMYVQSPRNERVCGSGRWPRGKRNLISERERWSAFGLLYRRVYESSTTVGYMKEKVSDLLASTRSVTTVHGTADTPYCTRGGCVAVAVAYVVRGAINGPGIKEAANMPPLGEYF